MTKIKGTDPSNEKRVQATNDDSIVSKRSASRAGYFKDDFLRFFVNKPANRSPLINRGYFIRCAAVRSLISEFLECPDVMVDGAPINKQIISVGAGFDTSYFHFAQNDFASKSSNVKNKVLYAELDFDGVVGRKSHQIKTTEELNRLLPNMRAGTKADVLSDRYALLECDLRDTQLVEERLKSAGINFEVPTLFLSEVVLTYMATEDSSRLIAWATSKFPCCQWVTYEQIHPDDTFGGVMCKNLTERGSPLLGVHMNPTLASQRERFISLGFKECPLMDLNGFWNNYMPWTEVERIENIEFFDEEEEWKIKCAHYFVSAAYKDERATGFFNEFSTKFSRYLAPPSTSTEAESHEFSWNSPDPREASRFKSVLQRWGHTVTEKNGVLYVFGGYGGDKSHSRLSDLHTIRMNGDELVVDEISTKTQPPARIFHTVVSWTKYLVLFGGRGGPDKAYNDLWVYDTEENSWKMMETLGTPPQARWRHSATLLGDKLIVYGGRDRNSFFSDTFTLDLPTLSWSSKNERQGPGPLCSHTCTAFRDDEMILYGGLKSTSSASDETWIYNVVDEAWRKVAVKGEKNPGKCFSHSAVMVERDGKKKLNLFGGVTFNGKSGGFYQLLEEDGNFTWNSVSVGSSEQNLFVRSGAAVLDGKIVVLGGGILCFSFGAFFSPVSVLSDSDNVIQLRRTENIPEISQEDSNRVVGTTTSSKKKEKKVKAIPRVTVKTREEFLEICDKRTPVVIVGTDLGPCTTTWTPDHMSQIFGTRPVAPKMNFVEKNFRYETMGFDEMIRRIYQPNGEEFMYLRSLGDNPRKDASDIWQSFPELSSDFSVPSWAEEAKPTSDKYHSSAFRLSSGGLHLWTHYDVMDNILCEIAGSKKVIMWHPREISRLYVKGSSSAVTDIEHPDVKKFPKFKRIKSRMETVLGPGEILFIPSLWFHHVEATEPCAAVNVFWKHLSDEHYEKKDLYGNKDIISGTRAEKEGEALIGMLKKIPEHYREFHARRIIDNIKRELSLSRMMGFVLGGTNTLRVISCQKRVRIVTYISCGDIITYASTIARNRSLARLAQSVERTALNRVVGGSSPPMRATTVFLFFTFVCIASNRLSEPTGDDAYRRMLLSLTASATDEEILNWTCKYCTPTHPDTPQIEVFDFFSGHDRDIFGFSGFTNESIVFIFRLLDGNFLNVWELLHQIPTHPNDWPKASPGMKTHTGHTQGYAGTVISLIDLTCMTVIREQVKDQVVRLSHEFPQLPIEFIGYSFGASTATLAVADVLLSNITDSRRVHLWTFGASRVGNREFSEYVNRNVGRSVRVANYGDPFVHVPRYGYEHVNTEYFVRDPLRWGASRDVQYPEAFGVLWNHMSKN
ncbi:leucine carboxyl methyltransferase 2-like [Planoprotostelium fungivorum]|uniref:tRNA wybutosine-synthesizing protein 4 n=1 Tax=Planoprotostelium fungivorum TaxID=1890364 RepID=A0A2P6N9M7_9EUKA|nr:leucine carboxyl methyltransferase 2-like [Planoprotostelium fungivorum]